MPLWDSVQRSLEKASQEAARIARTQRLRSTIDGLTRQIHTQQSNIINKAMDMFVAGQLAQGELYQLCQEMMNLQQQLNQARTEMQQLQVQASQSQTPTGPGGPVPNATGGESIQPAVYAPPPEYPSYLDSTSAASMPPPPPGFEALTVSTMETVEMNQGIPVSSLSAKQFCSVCQAELFPNHAFCQSCGAPVRINDLQHAPTMRVGTVEYNYPADEATMRADEPVNPSPPQHQHTHEDAARNEEV